MTFNFKNIAIFIQALLIVIASAGFWAESSCCEPSTDENACCASSCPSKDEASEDDCCELAVEHQKVEIKAQEKQETQTNALVFKEVWLLPIRLLLQLQLFFAYPENKLSDFSEVPDPPDERGRDILRKKCVLRI